MTDGSKRDQGEKDADQQDVAFEFDKEVKDNVDSDVDAHEDILGEYAGQGDDVDIPGECVPFL